MKKKISLCILILVMLILLTGCVRIDYSVVINKDGTGEISYIYVFTKEYLKATETTAELATKEMQDEAIEAGYTVELYSDEESEGFKARKSLNNITEVSLQEAFGKEYIEDTEENKIKIEKNRGSIKYSQNASIDLSKMDGMKEYVTLTYEITLPTKAVENNATTVSNDGKTLKWNLNVGEITEVNFIAESKSISRFLIVGIIVLFIIIIIAILIIVLINRKKVKK